MSSASATRLPESVRAANSVYDALAILHRRGFAAVDLNAIEEYRHVSDTSKLARFLRDASTVEEFLSRVARADSDYRLAVRESEVLPQPSRARAPERPAFVHPLPAFVGATTRMRELRALELLLRKRTKNNVLVCGPAGSGKTALVEALATLRPDLGPFWRVDTGALVGGTRHRGELESRLHQLFEFTSATRSTVFLDEIHALARMGVAEGAVNVLDVMKPHLVHPDFRIIGATTLDEMKFVLADPAFNRRFTAMQLPELTLAQLESVFDGFVESSPALTPFATSFPEVLAFVDRLELSTSRVDALLDFLEHAEAHIELHPSTGVSSTDQLRAVSASYAEFAYVPDTFGRS